MIPRAGQPSLGVVIVNWNGREHLLPCLASLQDSDLKPNLILVVDQGSRDDSVSDVKSSFPEVEIIELGTNVGFARGNNLGAEAAVRARCQLILFLNNDTIVAKDALRLMLEAAQAPEVQIVNPLITTLDGAIWFSGAHFSRLRGKIDHRLDPLPSTSRPHEIESATGCALLTTADVVRAYGPFDESYFIYYEDADLSQNIRRHGKRIILVPAARIEHRVSSDSLQNAPSGFFYYLNTRNRLLFTRRYLSTGQWLAFVAAFTSTYVIPRTLALILLGRMPKARALAKGYLDFFRSRFGPPRLVS